VRTKNGEVSNYRFVGKLEVIPLRGIGGYLSMGAFDAVGTALNASAVVAQRPALIHPSELMRMNFIRAEKLGSEADGLISIERLAGVDHHREKPRVCPNVQCNAGIN
jgi:hypothetical protein